MSSPLISVTLPNYNYGRFLEEAFKWVLDQSYPNLEILFVDDGSKDESRQIAEDFARQDSRVKPVYFKKNQGALIAHADTWARASGDLIYQYSSDDAVAHRDFFKYAVEMLERYPKAAGLYGVAMMVESETSEPLGYMGSAPKEGYIDPTSFIECFLSYRAFVPGISSIWKKGKLDSLGGYDYRLGPQTDYYVNHALPALHGVVFVNQVFAKARVSKSRKSFSANTTASDEMHRLARFEAKMRQHTKRLGNFDLGWTVWREGQARQLMEKYGRDIISEAGKQ